MVTFSLRRYNGVMDLKRVTLSLAVGVCFIGYSLGVRHPDDHGVIKPQSFLATKSTPAATPSAAYKDGTYTGSPADAFYGNIQVKVIVSGGKISDVLFLQYPNDRDTSIWINQQAMPMLRQEALRAQNARVDGVSGATDTSQAFIQSLASALAKAT